jgi:hypothetical protein
LGKQPEIGRIAMRGQRSHPDINQSKCRVAGVERIVV